MFHTWNHTMPGACPLNHLAYFVAAAAVVAVIVEMGPEDWFYHDAWTTTILMDLDCEG
jgi:hypothetical protein